MSYVTIQDWMTELDLQGNELIAFAVIYGFSQDGESHFKGSRNYLAKWCGCSIRTVQNILNSLVEKGYILKHGMFSNSQICEYSYNPEIEPVQKFHTPSEKIAYDKLTDNIGDINSSRRTIPETQPTQFNIGPFTVKSKKSLWDKCADVVYEYTQDYELRKLLMDYLSMRLAVKDKPIRGVNQWSAIVHKLDSLSGMPVDIVRQSLERGWLSFYPIQQGQSKNVKFSEGSGLSCTPSTLTDDERKRLLEEKGLRSEF